IILFQRDGNDWTARHEIRRGMIEGAAGMDSVELLGLVLGDCQHFHSKDAESLLLELFNNVADGIALHGVGFDDGKSALQSFHFGPWSLVVGRWRVRKVLADIDEQQIPRE